MSCTIPQAHLLLMGFTGATCYCTDGGLFALWRGFPWLVCIFSSSCTSLFLRVIRGGNGLVDGPVIPENLEKAMKKIAEEGFAHKQQVHTNLLYLV